MKHKTLLISSKNQIYINKAIRKHLDVGPGDRLIARVTSDSELKLTKAPEERIVPKMPRAGSA